MMEQPSLDNTFVDQTMTEEISDHKSSASIREYLCYKAYLDAQEGFQEWFRHFHQGKPIPLDPLPTYATFTEKVAYDHKKAQYQAELESWKATMQRHTKVSCAIIQASSFKTERKDFFNFWEIAKS